MARDWADPATTPILRDVDSRAVNARRRGDVRLMAQAAIAKSTCTPVLIKWSVQQAP